MHGRDAAGESLIQEHCDRALSMCVAASEWDEVLLVLDMMKRQGLAQLPSTYRAALGCCWSVDNADALADILRAMRSAGVVASGRNVAEVVYT